jgi:hypothetical protein
MVASVGKAGVVAEQIATTSKLCWTMALVHVNNLVFGFEAAEKTAVYRQATHTSCDRMTTSGRRKICSKAAAVSQKKVSNDGLYTNLSNR